MLLRLYANMNVSIGSILVCSVPIMSAYSFSHRTLGYWGKQTTILTCIGPLITLAPVILPLPSPSNGVNEPSV